MQADLKKPPRIRVLPHGVAERIAAGEVIERPSSVVKELVENSIDAGATEISVMLEEGGKVLIEVLDNGHGIYPEDLLVCIERHATSKLTSLEDLEKIQTLGFRGEALPSISAVSDLSILSRCKGESTAYEIGLTSLGKPNPPEAKTFGHFLNSPHGTRIQARGLFSQVPARLKFLKSQSAEVSQVREWIERLALAHPAIGFRLISDGRSILSLRPQDETARVRAILSDGEDYPIVTGTNDLGFRDRTEGSLHIRAHWLQGLSSPQARRLVQVVNGRAVRDRMLQQALMMPFRQALLPGQFPAVALYIEIDPSELDVNVHPTKTEIRFLDNRSVFRAVDAVVESMIVKNGAPGFVPSASSSETSSIAPITYRAAFEQKPELSSWRASQPDFKPMAFHLPPAGSQVRFPSQESGAEAQNETQSQGQLHAQGYAQSSSPTGGSEIFGEHPTQPPTQPLRSPEAQALLETFRPDRFMGTAFNTYLFYDLGTDLGLIDQHAAHERIRYEILRRSALTGARAVPQALLLPEAVRFPAEQRAMMESRLPWLTEEKGLGFECEIFGEDTLLFRAIPASWGADELRPRLKNLVDRVLSVQDASAGLSPGLSMDENLFEKLASEACHSAVRAGDRLEREEATALVGQLFDCEHPWNCPHGRPTIVRVPKGRVEEWFQRRV